MQWQAMQMQPGVPQQPIIVQQPMAPMTSYQQQMYWQQYYPQWTAVPAVQMTPGVAMQPQPHKNIPQPPRDAQPPPLPPEVEMVVKPAPPVEPPKEEKPPLPPEPPPPEPAPPPSDKANETDKMNSLQAQAAQWQMQQQQQQQWQKYQQDLYNYQQQLQQWQQSNSPENIQKNLDSVCQEETEFEKSFSDWMKQYTSWKEANKNHPNQEQYKQYEQQWKTYEAQMTQKRQDIDQRKKTLENQLRQVQGNAPTAPQMPNQWNNQASSNNQWVSQNNSNSVRRGPDGFQGAPRFPAPRGPRDQGPRFDNPSPRPDMRQSRFERPSRFGGPQQRFDPPKPRVPDTDSERLFADDDYNDYDNSSDMNMQGNSRQRSEGQFGEYENSDFGNQMAGGPKGGQFGGEGRGMMGNQGQRFGGVGRGGGGRPSGGPVPLMALNIEKPKSFEKISEDNSAPRNNDDKPLGTAMLHGDEEMLSQMGLPTSFGGPIIDDDDERSRPWGNQPPGPPRGRGVGLGPRNDFHGSTGPRGPGMNRQGSQDDRFFGSRGGMGGGPRGPRPPGPRGFAPSRDQVFHDSPGGGPGRAPWDDDPTWKFSGDREDRPPSGGSGNPPQNPPGDPSKIQLSPAQLSMIKGVTQELSQLRDQQEKLHQLQKLQDAFEAEKNVPPPVFKASQEAARPFSQEREQERQQEESFGVKVHDYAHGGSGARPRPLVDPFSAAERLPPRDPWASRFDDRRPPSFDDPYYREYGRVPPAPRDPLYDPYRRGYYDRYGYASRDPFTRGRSPPRLPGAEATPGAGPVEVVDYGHGEDKNKRTPPVEDPWVKGDSKLPEDPWAKPTEDPWDKEDRLFGDSSKERLFSRDTRELPRISREAKDNNKLKDPWDREETRGRDREWRDRSPVRERERDRDRDRDRRRDRDRTRFSPAIEHNRDMFGRDKPGRNSGVEDSKSFGNRQTDSSYSSADRYYRAIVSDSNTKIESVTVEDLLCEPGRKTRPEHLVVILRGLPGSGKSHIAKLLKDKEVSNGGSTPRILSIDDYFMAEHDLTVKDPDTGKTVTKTEMKYEYEAEMEDIYRQSLLKSFKKQIDNLFFNFIIVDSFNEKVEYFEAFWSYAKSKGFQVYTVEIQAEANACFKRNTHSRTLSEILQMNEDWEETPRHYLRLDIRTLLQDIAITEVEMEEAVDEPEVEEEKISEEEEDDFDDGGFKKSRWELDVSEARLDQLDGIRKRNTSESSPQHMMDYLQLPDDYETRSSGSGKKRVRWADIEEKKSQDRAREIGFVVGQTDWNKIMDDNYAQNALNKTKYI